MRLQRNHVMMNFHQMFVYAIRCAFYFITPDQTLLSIDTVLEVKIRSKQHLIDHVITKDLVIIMLKNID